MRKIIDKEVYRQLKKIEHQEHKLSYLFWECTHRCTLSCLHCGSDCVATATHPDMPREDFFRVLDQINEHEHERTLIVITGGEPLLRRDLEECGYGIRERGFNWGIVTNGYAYTPERHKSLLAAGMNSITVSLDGTEQNHTWLRNNPQSFERAVNAMHLIGSAKHVASDVVTCVNKRNIKELDKIYETVAASGISAWRLFTISPIGRAKNNPELTLDKDEFTYLMEYIKTKRSQKGLDVKFSCEGYVGKYEKQVRDDYFFCRAGIHIGSILIDGSIGACPNIDRVFVQGNIYTDNFVEVWNEKYKEYRDRKWMKSGICSACKQFRYCLGNGMHYRQAGDPNVIQCHFRQIL